MTGSSQPEREVAVLGLGKSGTAAARLLRSRSVRVYASDAGSSPTVEANAAELRALGVLVDTGTHDLGRISRASRVVVSPGIDPQNPPVAAALEAGVPLVSEIEIALESLSDSQIIAVTGTNGKTTTTALIGHLLRGLGVDAVDAGNIGTPLSEMALREKHPEWIALEMSSFQLHDTPGLKPKVGVLTNLTPDHLDRYRSTEDYYSDKARLFSNATPSSRWVLNADDTLVGKMAASVAGEKFGFSTRTRSDAWLDDATGAMMLRGDELMQRSELGLLGDHNVANALAAALAVSIADDRFASTEALRKIADALRSFHSLSHRLEIVGEVDGVQWINDSKATNVSSTLVAISGMRRPTVLLLGGRHKGEPYTGLTGAIKRSVKKVIAFGEAGPEVQKDLGDTVALELLGSDFGEVIRHARESAQPGDAVLLSPACSSFDMFKNYEERGATFRRLALGRQ
ncbi:MAG TPA: UDP-N-acetylmuramoyl-L-alanine--D-glutamate ligase [Gemmatimonadaceae bacterium]|nr:UDP-N-acetylmuramoyl-L-alanine--D-glutamate ligase [Gemmatimonadaceae bacterium]